MLYRINNQNDLKTLKEQLVNGKNLFIAVNLRNEELIRLNIQLATVVVLTNQKRITDKFNSQVEQLLKDEGLNKRNPYYPIMDKNYKVSEVEIASWNSNLVILSRDNQGSLQEVMGNLLLLKLD